MVYQGLFYSKIIYGIVGWRAANANILDNLQSLKNKNLNIIQYKNNNLSLKQI